MKDILLRGITDQLDWYFHKVTSTKVVSTQQRKHIAELVKRLRKGMYNGDFPEDIVECWTNRMTELLWDK